MGNTPSHPHGSHPGSTSASGSHGSPSGPHRQAAPSNGGGLDRSNSTSRRHAPNLRLPMPQRPTHISPQSSNPTSPSGRPGSPRRRKSLELPDLNKLSFTPAAPLPTTATNTSNHLAPSTPAAVSNNRDPSPSSRVAAEGGNGGSGTKKWQQALGGRVTSPLGGGLAPLSKVDSVKPTEADNPYFSSPVGQTRPIPIVSPRGVHQQLPPSPERPQQPSAMRRPDVIPNDTPQHTNLTPPPPPPPPTFTAPTPTPEEQISRQAQDGLVDVPITWNGGGKVVYVTGNFADNWKERIKLRKSTHDFNTILRLPPGQYRLKFIVDESWRCSKAIPTATDDDGTLVNWIEVETPKTEEEMNAEWAIDTKPAAKEEDTDDSQWTSDIPVELVCYQYLEELPQLMTDEQYRHFRSSSYLSAVPKPPVVPRILERVILNNEPRRADAVALDGSGYSAPPATLDDNSILATPNHTVLNHLMASAIKNGTLGVGTTTRYRKKYITTMFFKPTPGDLFSGTSNPANPPPPIQESQPDASTEANQPASTENTAPQ